MNNKELDIIVPIGLNPYKCTCESIVNSVLNQHESYGFTRFVFCTPSKGWRSVGYPPREHYIECAELFSEVKKRLENYNIECGWYISLTLKSGFSDEFTSPVKQDGSIHKFSSCPLDPKFQKRLAEDVALFAKIARPDFIFTEDDFSIRAVNGCFCEHHLNEFARRQGKYYSREELTEIFSQESPEAYKLLRAWRELAKDSLVELAQAMRSELDKETPGIPMGYSQPGGVDHDGDATEAVSRALAGGHHTPFSRLYGTFYCGVNVKAIPEVSYHSLYSKQHIQGDFKFYHESDGYPHSKFYTEGKHMNAIVSTAFSYGMDGSLFWADGLDKEPVYGKMFAEERKRFNAIYGIAKQCKMKGVEIDYDPFWNTVDNSLSTDNPLWVRSISRFGIPYTSINSQVAFWDMRQAKYADHDTIMDRLSKGLFLDGDAAKALCERGYGKYLGVEVGEDVIADTPLVFDLGAREVICERFVSENKGRTMAPAHMFCPRGNGKWLKLDVTNEKCEVVTNAYTSQDKLITPTMVRFENDLGGKIVVMSLTLDGNNSQALFNYGRQRLIQQLITWCSDEYVYVKEAPDMFVVANESDDESKDFIGVLTMINLCADELNSVELHLPEKWKIAEKFLVLTKDGEWEEISFERTADGVILYTEYKFCEAVYILAV